ncbi:hypothetical protein NBRC116590_26960 [Pelagimonas sp. KU-00592-HH]|uniref:hypothetical protein n=1 Tax=Pelagimonas sp. KU-00592-HH TaxID=3127651 RepID=UPI0031076755
MKVVLLLIGVCLGYVAHILVDLKDNYSKSIAIAEAHCVIAVLSDTKLKHKPSELGCKLIVDDDFLLTFQVTGVEGLFVDCLPPQAYFRSELSVRECILYRTQLGQDDQVILEEQ